MSSILLNTGTGSLLTFALVATVLGSPAYYDNTIFEEPEVENRILGGSSAAIEEFPFQLALEGGGRQMCGGSILSKDWALTAAHCVYNQPLKWLAFRAGSLTREHGGSVHPVHYYIYHNLYRKATLDYDVAVVRVRVPFVYGPRVQRVSLPTFAPRQKEFVTVSGWGYLENEQLRKPRDLMATDIFIVDWKDCKKLYPGLTPRMLCAGDRLRDFCVGDSGGPLIRSSQEQVGIVSWSYKCGDGLPSVYTNISSVSSWIRTNAVMDPEPTDTEGSFIAFPTD